jgi:GNAT superfamily N-acetyltransferase
MDPVDFNYAHSINVFGSTGKTGEVLEARDFVLANSKAPVAEFNQAILKTPRYKLARTLERMFDFYGRAKVPFRLHVMIDDAAITSELLARGFTRALDLPCMVFQGARCEAPEVSGLHIGTVRDDEGLADFQRVAFEGFGYPVEIAPVALTSDLIALPHFSAYVGYVNGTPAVCSASITTGDVTGIYWVSTLAAHRKLGLGAALTAHAANEGLARGARTVCLQASKMGFPVYQRIGFSHPRTYLRFDHAAL